MYKDELRMKMGELPCPETELRPPYWEYWRKQLWELVTSDGDPDEFYSFPCIYHTMLVNHWADVVEEEMSVLPSRYIKLASMPRVSTNDFVPQTNLSRNLIHSLYHYWLWEQYTGLNLADFDSIVDIGAGYGAMALIANRLGFRGDYYIYDLPEFSLLQEYYLSNCETDGVDYHWNAEPKPVDTDLLIACYSLSEMPIKDRDVYLMYIHANSYLFLFSERWTSYNNLKYFESFGQTLPIKQDWDWMLMQSSYLPAGNWYAIGKAGNPDV